MLCSGASNTAAWRSVMRSPVTGCRKLTDTALSWWRVRPSASLSAALKAGADIVVGHHPHIVQGIEAYNDSYILYSLGNLVFGGNVDPDDRDAYAARLTFTVYEDHADAPELTIVPLRLTELDKGTDYRPVLAGDAEGERIVSRILKRSSNMSGFVNGDWRTQAN